MKKTIFFTAAIAIALFLSFTLTGGLFTPSNDAPIVKTYWLSAGDSVETFYIGGYKNLAVTVVDTAYADTVFCTLGGSDVDENYPTTATAIHDISGTTLTTLTASLIPGVSGTATGVFPQMNFSEYPFSWLKVSRKNMTDAGHRTKILVKLSN